MKFEPSISDYRVDFIVRGVDKEACIKRFIAQREKKEGPIVIEFDRNFKFVIGLDGIESFARYLFGPYAYESDLSGPLETYQRAKDFADLARKGGGVQRSDRTALQGAQKPRQRQVRQSERRT